MMIIFEEVFYPYIDKGMDKGRALISEDGINYAGIKQGAITDKNIKSMTNKNVIFDSTGVK